jgi:hypothetical protein
MRRTVGRAGCLGIAATFAACAPATPTGPSAKPTRDPASPSTTIVLIDGDTLPPCPEIVIPELRCVRRDPRHPERVAEDE